jgi:hypothetical protein
VTLRRGRWNVAVIDHLPLAARALCAAAIRIRYWSERPRPSTTRPMRGKGVAGSESTIDWEQLINSSAASPTRCRRFARRALRLTTVGPASAAEFSHIAVHAGSEVIVLEQAERSPTGFDPDLVDRHMERSRALGVGRQRVLYP